MDNDLRRIEVLRNNEWIKVRLKEVKRDEIFRIYEDDKLLNDTYYKATSDGFLWDIAKDIGGVDAIEYVKNSVLIKEK